MPGREETWASSFSVNGDESLENKNLIGPIGSFQNSSIQCIC